MADEATKTGDAGTQPPADKQEAANKTFSQEELDRVVGERLARERAKFEGFDDLKAKAARFDELEEQQKSELQKAQEQLEKAQQETATLRQQHTTTLLRSAVVSEASRQGAVDPDAVVALLPSDSVTLGDDGQVTGVESAVKALLDSKPYLVGQTPRPGSGDGGARPAPQATTTDPKAALGIGILESLRQRQAS